LLQFKKYHPSVNLKYNILGISKSFKFRIFNRKNSFQFLKLNFTPNTLGCYGLIHYRPARPFGNRIKKNILGDLFSSKLSQFKKISTLWKPEIE